MIEPVVAMEGLASPMEINFPFRVHNVTPANVWITAQLVAPPAGWANWGEQQMGAALASGASDYCLYSTPTRIKPVTNTEENVTLRITYYSDAYITEINHEDVAYSFTYVDFDDVGYNVVDEDTFELDVEGWIAKQWILGGTISRSTSYSRTGTASLKAINASESAQMASAKEFTIANLTRAFFRAWVYVYTTVVADKFFLWLITDASNLSAKRVIPIPLSVAPRGGSEIMQQWLCIGGKLPVNGTYEVQLLGNTEYKASGSIYVYMDDVKVVES